MMQHTNHSHSLETILTSTQEKMHELLQMLNDETAVLKKNDIEELENITQKKITLTKQIEENEQQRIHFLSANSLNPNEPAQWLQNNKLITTWEKIKNLSEQAQKQNQVNGLVINGNRNRVQTQIEILSTSSPAAELVYSATGKNIKQHNSNTLAHV